MTAEKPVPPPKPRPDRPRSPAPPLPGESGKDYEKRTGVPVQQGFVQPFGLCGCGNPVRYIMPNGGPGSCNKYMRCPSYNDVTVQRDELRDLCSKLAKLVDSVDNGHCQICRGFRGFEFLGEQSFAGDCENKSCVSHQIGRLLPERRKAMAEQIEAAMSQAKKS